MQIYDSSKKIKLEFKPEGETVRIYVCGPTVYDHSHLGHAKSAISFDLLRRVLIELGYKLKFVRNYTDIDDKILKKMSETNKPLEEITNFYIKSYEDDMKALNVLDPDIKPKATECVDDMIDYISNLINKGFAYKLDDGIYFDTTKDKHYLSISGRENEENSIARIETNNCKNNQKDFVLWKFDENFYDSPFGKGRPGWHSECVAMIKKYLSNDSEFEVDIHAGGSDLLFPHHENEAAQCRCGEEKTLSKYWMHNGFIQINNEKMAKSLGNSFFVKDALKLYHGEVIRFYLLSTHYRANFNYSLQDLNASKKRLDKLYRLKKRVYGVKESEIDTGFKDEILKALSDDLNTSKALAVVDEFVANANEALDKEPKNKSIKSQIVANISFINKVIGIGIIDNFEYFQFGIDEQSKQKIDELISKRDEAKKAKDFQTADKIREELTKMQISIMDTANGTFWEKI
ncbi:cysteinyl-tRNA synthetase [Campylobacter pinnipediorum subsp. pinnipediorum]|uniref:cysteine--tRNA ligase n=1 Tax=Campylobacter pinnipediorum TaxID=1965231 RepID=UPI000994D757|nr:cysteine--tRNA ligase [Campylobacter pinnipediorum]AQW80917.1 cysteinyl-tRNA synthetase [Campylobacter pinnipediorum subsp. pinnipediorum]